MKTIKDVFIIGFALFSMFFGAGNLVFPPYLGLLSGRHWITAFWGFIIADVGLAMLAILAAAKHNGEISSINSKAGEKLGLVLSIIIITCLGPLLAIPRTGATTYEVGIAPLFKGVSPLLSSCLFFLITLLLTIKPSKVIDILGQWLTPLLLLALFFLIIRGIFYPLGHVFNESKIRDVFSNGIAQGYQTMDALGAIALSFIVISSIVSKGYKDQKQKIKMTVLSGLVAAVGLILVYGGLAYLGATTSSIYKTQISQTVLIVNITSSLLGYTGKVVLAIIVSLACLTTAIGLTSAAASFYEELFKNKISYSTIVVIICLFSTVVSNFGVSAIISFSSPILSIIYPVAVVIIIMTLMENQIKNRNTYKGAIYSTLLTSILTTIQGYGLSLPYISRLPLSNISLNWIIPAIVGGILGSFIKIKKSKPLL